MMTVLVDTAQAMSQLPVEPVTPAQVAQPLNEDIGERGHCQHDVLPCNSAAPATGGNSLRYVGVKRAVH